jgi:hypothetical protein
MRGRCRYYCEYCHVKRKIDYPWNLSSLRPFRHSVRMPPENREEQDRDAAEEKGVA